MEAGEQIQMLRINLALVARQWRKWRLYIHNLASWLLVCRPHALLLLKIQELF
jgi:hypothetical protein